MQEIRVCNILVELCGFIQEGGGGTCALTTVCQNYRTNKKFMYLRRLKFYALQSGKSMCLIYNETF